MSAAGSRGGGGRKGSDSDWSSKSGVSTSRDLTDLPGRGRGEERESQRERQRQNE
jgi:hypothetical protein